MNLQVKVSFPYPTDPTKAKLECHNAPKTPSVTVSPSGEIEEGSSVTLSCSSDANPAANYTWFKKKEGLQKSMWTRRKGRYHRGALTNRLAHAAQREPIEEQDGHHCAIIHTSSSDNQDEDQTEMGGTSEL
ncbi:unnamed protein product [Gadus morhua 'NCC']